MITYDDVFEDLRYNGGNNTSDLHLVRTTAYLIKNLQDNHRIPVEEYNRMWGIGEWYMTKGFMTEKQSYWLKINLVKYEQEIDPMKAYA